MTTAAVPTVELSDGHKMPIIGLGTWQGTFQTDTKAIAAIVEAAIDLGYRHIDTAQMYFTEVGIGEGIQSAIKKGKVKRENLFVTTKLFPAHHLREDVVRHLKKSLERLKLEYVDLFLIHFPCPLKPSEDDAFQFNSNGEIIYNYADEIDLLDTWKGLEDAHALGLTKSIGVSNFNKRQIERLVDNCRIKPVTNQVEVSLFLQNKDLINLCQTKGITVTGYKNLESLNQLTSVDKPGLIQKPDMPNTDVLEDIARRVCRTVHQVALRYQIQRGVVVIPKSNKETRMRQNLEAVSFELTDADMKALEQLEANKRILKLFPDSKEYPFNDPY